MTDAVESSVPVEPSPELGRAHAKTVWALITLATLILTLSGVNTWLERQLLDTDNWVDTTAVLLEDDDLRMELATYLVNELYASVDVGEAIAERLPEDLAGLGSPVAAVLRDPLINTVDVVLQSRPVQELWRTANRDAHTLATAILEDDTRSGVSTAGGKVTLDLGALVREVGNELGVPSDALDKLPEGTGQVTIVDSDKLEAAQFAVKAIKVLSVLLFLVVVGLYGLAIYLASNWRREATRNVGLATAFGGFVLLVVVQVSTGWIVDGAETSSGKVVAGAVLPAATALLQETAWTALFMGLLTASFAGLLGSSRLAVSAQGGVAPGFRRQPATTWVGIGFLILLILAWGPISVTESWLSMLLIVTLVVVGIEALRRTSLARAESTMTVDAES